MTRTGARRLTTLITTSLIAWNGVNAQPNAPSMLIEKDVRVRTRGGFEVSANVYRPNTEGRFPVIISMGPYGKDDLPAQYDGTFSNGQIVVSEHAAFETPDPEYWVHFDYVVITADSPGSGLSGGDMDLFGPIENKAFYDLIEWAGVQPWSNGNVGLGGVSYFGVTQWYVAALNPPHLKAIMPSDGLTDLYRDAAIHGGIPSDFIPSWSRFRIYPVKRPDAAMVRDIGLSVEEHPLFDEFWRTWLPDLDNISTPAYVVASWPDHGLHTRGTLIGFERIGSAEKWLDIHGRKKWEHYYSRESLERQRRFYDYYLKGIDNGMADIPTVRYERRNVFYDGEIVFTDSWPLSDAEYRPYFLTEDGSLSVVPADEPTVLRYAALDEYQQLAFSHTFRTDTEVTGTARLRLWVEADGSDDMDLYVGLSKFDRHGNEVLMAGYGGVEHGHVASGWLRVSHRELDTERSTRIRPVLRHDRLSKLRPDERVPVEIEILPSSTMFRQGESLVLRIQGTELPGAGDITHLNTVNAGDHVVYVGGETDSQLVLPVIPRQATPE